MYKLEISWGWSAVQDLNDRHNILVVQQYHRCFRSIVRGTIDHSKQDQICLVKVGKCIGFGGCRRSYLLWHAVLMIDGVLSSYAIMRVRGFVSTM